VGRATLISGAGSPIERHDQRLRGSHPRTEGTDYPMLDCLGVTVPSTLAAILMIAEEEEGNDREIKLFQSPDWLGRSSEHPSDQGTLLIFQNVAQKYENLLPTLVRPKVKFEQSTVSCNENGYGYMECT